MSSIVSFFPPGFSILGGIPIKDQDFVASIVYTAAYIVLIPVAIWRLISRNSRCMTLVRPAIFIQARMATYIVRAVISKGHYSTGLFIAEQILLLCGFVLLCEPLLGVLEYHITRFTPPSNKRNRVAILLRILEIGLFAALALGVYAGTQYGNLNNSSAKSKVQTCRDANAIICAAITAIVGLLVIAMHFKHRLPAGGTIYILTAAVLLTVSGIYKIFIYETSHPPSPVHKGTKIAFYLLSALPEIIVATMFVGVNVNRMFDIQESRRRAKEFKDGGIAHDEYQLRGQY